MLPGSLCQLREETGAAAGDFSSLPFRNHRQEFVLLLNGVAEAER